MTGVPNDSLTATLAESVSNLKLTDAEEDELLDRRGGGEDWSADVPDDYPIGTAAAAAMVEEEPKPTTAMLIDAQMVFHRGRGSLVKELAFKMLDGPAVTALTMIHDAKDVPAHLVVSSEDGRLHYDVHSGLALEDGECPYDDRHVANILSGAGVVFVKGANKKEALSHLCDRVERDSSAVAPFNRPTIVNVDGHTADEEDRQFCKERGIRLAAFSFPFVYTNMHVFEKILRNPADRASVFPGDFLYVSNVLAKDPRYELSGKGRIVCICYNDHSRGGTVSAFDKKQRCSLLNISILDHLWLRQQDALFRELVKSERRYVAEPRRGGGGVGYNRRRRRSGRRSWRNRGAALRGNEGDARGSYYYWDAADEYAPRHRYYWYREEPSGLGGDEERYGRGGWDTRRTRAMYYDL